MTITMSRYGLDMGSLRLGDTLLTRAEIYHFYRARVQGRPTNLDCLIDGWGHSPSHYPSTGKPDYSTFLPPKG
jgi:hypothetical protein